jgi:hydrogenase nickel incorporation protein HypA/HybF
MHELSIALSLLDIVAEQGQQQQGRIVSVHVRLGPLSGVDKAALHSAYALAREGTAEEAVGLVIEEVPLTGFCQACAAERSVTSVWEMTCSECGTAIAEVLHGRELEVVGIEVEP